jgi:hypothetical protein
MWKQMAESMPDGALHALGARLPTITITFSLFGLLLKCGIGAILLTLVADLISGRGGLSQMLALTITLSVVSLLEPLHALILLIVRGIENIHSSSDFEVRMGLRYLVPDARPGFATLLNSINIYQFLTLWFAVVGVSSLCECSRAIAVVIVSIYWALWIAFKIMSAEVCAIGHRRLAMANDGEWEQRKGGY